MRILCGMDSNYEPNKSKHPTKMIGLLSVDILRGPAEDEEWKTSEICVPERGFNSSTI